MLNRNSVNFNSIAHKQIFLKHKLKKQEKCKLISINSSNHSKMLKKGDIKFLKLVGQFDTKFLIFMLDQSIVIFDQHAIHERILFEYYTYLLKNEFNCDNLTKVSEIPLIKYNCFQHVYSKYYLKQPIIVNFAESKNILNKLRKFDLQKLNSLFHFDFIMKSNQIHLVSIPIIFDKLYDDEFYAEIFKNIISILDELINSNSSSDLIANILLNCTKSKACRNSVKFNDELDNEFTQKLKDCLELCNDPFLCAHGRHNFFIIGNRK